MSSIVKFNIDDFVTGGKLPFNESEKNLAAFKGLFSVTNTSNFHDSFKRERFAKNFNVYPDDVISNASKIPLENLEINVKPSKIRTWVTGSNLLKLDGSTCYDPMERLYRGHFSESILEEGNPNIEKIICPLTKIQGASNQFYTLFAKENLTAQEYFDIYSGLPSEPNGETEYRFISGTRKIEVDQFTNEFPTDGHLIYTDKIDELTHIPGALVGPVSLTNLGQLNSVFGTKQGTLTLKEADPSLIFDERKHILKNFITPFKFGTGYNVKIHASFLGNGNRTSLAGSPNDDLAVFPDSETSNPFLGSIPASSADQINPTGGPSGFVENNSKWFSAGFVDEDGNKAMLCPVDCLSRHNPIFDGGGITDTIIVESILTANHRRQTGGALFDFKEGSLFIGVQTVSQEENPSLPNQSGSTPNIAEYSHPLWIEAFRYIGPTGSSFNEDITATNISASGFISASEFVGDGSGLTNVTATAEWDGSLDGDASITGSLIVSGNADSGNISASGYISASYFSGDGSGLTNVTVTQVAEWDGSRDGDASITGSLIVSGNADSGNISASGYVSASSFSGDGSGLTSTPLFISGAYNEGGDQVSKNFQKLQFDYSTGIHVSESSDFPDTAFVSLGSAFHHFSASNGTAKATGSDTIIFEAGNNMTIEVTDPVIGVDDSHHKITFTSNQTEFSSITVTGDITASNISASGHISASSLFISGNTKIVGDLELGGAFDFDSFTFTSDTVATLTGSNTFGSTASLNQHTFTGSVVISSSQAEAFSIVDGDSTNFKITPSGEVTSLNINVNGNIIGNDSTIISNIHDIQTDLISSDENQSTQLHLENNQIFALVNDTDVFSVSSTRFLFDSDLKSVLINPPLTASIISASGNVIGNNLLVPRGKKISETLESSGDEPNFIHFDSSGTSILFNIDNNEILKIRNSAPIGVVITGSLIVEKHVSASGLNITGSSTNKNYITIGSSSTHGNNESLYNIDGVLYWGGIPVASPTDLSSLLLEDENTPTLGGILNLNGFDVISQDTTTNSSNITLTSVNSDFITISSKGISTTGNVSIAQSSFPDENLFNVLEATSFIGPVTASDIDVGCLHANQITASNATINTLTGDNINFQNLVVNATVVNGGITIETPGEIGDPEVYQNFPHKDLLFLNDNADNLSDPLFIGDLDSLGFFATSASLVDGDINTANGVNLLGEVLTGNDALNNMGLNFEAISDSFPLKLQNSALNIIWDFETPVLLDSFRIDFSTQKGQRIANAFKFIEIFGSNQPYLEDVSGVGPGENSTTGEYMTIGATGQLLNKIEINPEVDTDFLGNPIFSNNLSSATTVVAGQEITASNIDLGNALGEGIDASLNQTYRYYRLRFSASLEGAPQNIQLFREITPVTRSFVNSTFEITSDCVSVCSASVAISSSYALTASFALNAEDSDPFPFIGDAEITGSLEVMTPGEVTTITTTNTVDAIELIDTNITAIQNFTSSHEGTYFTLDQFGLIQSTETINGGVYPYAILGCHGNTGLPLTTPEEINTELPSGEYAPTNAIDGTSNYGRWDVTNNGPNNTFHPGAAASLNMFEDTESYIEFTFDKLNNVSDLGNPFGDGINTLAIDFDFFDYLGFEPIITKMEITFPDNYGSSHFTILRSTAEQNFFSDSSNDGGFIGGAGSGILFNAGNLTSNNTTVNNSVTLNFSNDTPCKRIQIIFPAATFNLNPYFQNTESDIKLRIQNIKFFQKTTTTETTEEIIYGDGSLVSILSGSVTASNGFHGTASNAISSSYALTASYALNAQNASGEDDDWFIVDANYITSSRDVLITGSLDITDPIKGSTTIENVDYDNISTNKATIKLNGTKSLYLEPVLQGGSGQNVVPKTDQILVIGSNEKPPHRQIKLETAQSSVRLTQADLTTTTNFKTLGSDVDTSNGDIEAAGSITSSFGIRAQLKEVNFSNVVVVDTETGDFHFTASTSLPRDDDWFVEDTYLTSSRDVHITNSLFVKNTTETKALTASKARITTKLDVGSSIETGPFTANIEESLFIVNPNDVSTDHGFPQGIGIKTHGNDNATGGTISFKRGDSEGNSVINGFSLIYNGGTLNSILDMPANSFALKSHKDTQNGHTILLADATNNRIGINEPNPSFDLDVNADAQIQQDLHVGRDISCSRNIVANGDIRAKGNIIAEQFIISSSISHFTQSFSSGSTMFGDTLNDSHEFTGSVRILGSLTASGDISSSGNLTIHHITASGNISASGYVSASHFAGSGSGLVGVPIFVTGGIGIVENSEVDPITGESLNFDVARSFQRLHFDYHTGIHVSESSPDTAFISLGSAFHIFSASNGAGIPTTHAVSTGSDEIIFEAGDNMTIEITEPEDPSDPASHHKIIFTSDGGSFPYSGSDIVTGSNPHTPSAAVITGSLFLSGSGHITASGMVLAKEMVSSSVIRANTYMVNDDKVFAQFLQNFGSIEAGTIVLGDVTAPDPIFVNTTELTLAGTRGITSMNPITASTFGTNNVSISASGVISASHLHLFTSGSTFDLENPELSTDPTLYVSGNAYISGYLDLDGPFDFSGFTFIQDVVAELTGSTSFGSTASLNGHTFTGSIVVSSSQTPAFSVVDGNQTNFSISPNGELSSSALISSSGNIEGLNIFASNDLTVGNDADITNGETNILQINFVGSPSEADPSGVTTGPSLFTHFEGEDIQSSNGFFAGTHITASQNVSASGTGSFGELFIGGVDIQDLVLPFPYSGSDEINTERNTAAVITGSLTLSGSGNITASGQVQIGPLSEGIPYTVQVNDDIQEFKGQPNKVTIFTSGAKDMSLSETDQVLDPFIVPFALSSSQFQGTGFADTSIDGHTRQFQGNFGEPQIRFGARDLNLPHINSTSGSLLDVAAKRYFNLINTHKKDFVIRGYNSERLAKEYKANHPGTRYTLDSQHFPADFVIKSKKSGHGDINLLNQVEPPFFIESDKPGLSTVGIGVSPFSLDASSTTLTVGGNIKLFGNTRFSDGGDGEDGGLETSNSGFIKTRILTDHKDGILIDCSLTSSRDISLNNNHFNGTNSLLFDSPSSNERRFVNLNVHNTATSHSIVTSNSISSSGAIYGKQRETTCHNHQISSTQKYFIPFVTDQEFVATQQDNDVNVLRTTFVAPNSGKLISMTYHPVITVLSKGQIVGAPVISLFINGAFQGLTNNGFASPNSSHQIILDPTHRRFGTNGGGIFNFQGSANSAEDLLQSSRFRAGDLIRIQIQRSLFPDGFNSGAIAASVNQTLCSLVWEYEYNDEGYP